MEHTYVGEKTLTLLVFLSNHTRNDCFHLFVLRLITVQILSRMNDTLAPNVCLQKPNKYLEDIRHQMTMPDIVHPSLLSHDHICKYWIFSPYPSWKGLLFWRNGLLQTINFKSFCALLYVHIFCLNYLEVAHFTLE